MPPPGGSFPPPPPGGLPPGPVPFNQIPFGQFLQDHSLNELIPTIPPMFQHGTFGEFQFGQVPPPPPGFPPFPPPPPGGVFGPPIFGPPPPGGFPPGTPPPLGTPGVPPGLPPGLPEALYRFHEARQELFDALQDLPLPPFPPFPPGVPGVPGVPGAPGVPPPFIPLYVSFDQVAEFLLDFLPPEQAVAAFEAFGQNNPLIGEGNLINPELETAAFDHPPVPLGYQGFDFKGDFPQFDDLFTIYDSEHIGDPMTGQINSTFSNEMPDGSTVFCSETSVVEALLGEATPLIEMADGVLQTQWVVDVHQTAATHVIVENPDLGDVQEYDLTKEIFSQVTWTMLIQEVDTDGDGVVDQILTTGSNAVEVVDEQIEGEAPLDVPESPTLLQAYEFDTVLEVAESESAPVESDATSPPGDGTAEPTNSTDSTPSDETTVAQP